MAIPKIIHYCWYGGKPLPRMLEYCIDSWKEFLPHYQFILWNEDNMVFDCEFIRNAYTEKKWAFVSDYVRLKAVYEYGGIYMDTDMLLLKSLDDFLSNQCFFGAEHPKSINASIFGAEKNNDFIHQCLEIYQRKNFFFVPIPKIVSDVFIKTYRLKREFIETITLENIVIYEVDYFYSLPYGNLFDIHHYQKYVTKNSYGVHLWHGSWHNYNELVLLRRKEYYKALKKIYKTILIERKLSMPYLKKIGIAFKDAILTPNAFK